MSQASSSQPRATKRQLSLSSQPQPGSSKRPRTHILLSTSLEVSETLATLAKEAADDIGVAGLGVGLAVLAEVLKRIRIKKMNIDGINTLLGRIQELFTILDDDKASRGNSGRLSGNVQRRIESLSDKWQTVIEDPAKTKERNMVIRFFTAKIDAEKITDLVKTMNESIQDFQLSVILDMDATAKETNATVETTRVNVVETHAAVEGTRITVNDVRAIVEKTHATADNTHEDVQKLWDDLKGTREIIQQVATKQDDFVLPKGARNAQYDSNSTRRPCLPKTRTDVLFKLRQWIIIACTQPQLSAQIFWIHGLAGTGKTTIAYSIAQECDGKGLLAGNYFCSRFDAECSDPNFIFTTLSRQMCRVHARFKQLVAEVLRKNPDIVDAGPARQLEELIVKPLEACHSAEDPFPTSVIVIDALDECRNGNPTPSEDGSAWSGAQSSTSIILATLAKFIPRLRPLLFIITSRPESHITPLFERPSRADDESLHPVTSPFGLHEVHLKSVLDDIRFYLDSEFRAALKIYHSREGWPAAQDITTLAEQSGGLWIYAATATRFIFNDGVEDPERQLESLIRGDAPSVEPTTILFFLYNQVVKASYKKISDQLAMRLRSILGAIALSQEALSVPSLASLLNIEDHIIRNALKGLHSVLRIPPPGSTEVIRIIHPTFPEFLLYDSPDKHAAFRITPTEEHNRLFSRCLEIIRAPDGLRYDIVGLGDPCRFKTEVGDLGERIKQSIPVHLKYAVRFWSAHLTGGHLSSDGSCLFQSFLYRHLLHWLEASSILNGLDTAVASLEAARRICQASSSVSAGLRWFLHDARRFALTYAPCINAAPLQVYHSALDLAPSSSLILQAYSRVRRKESLVVCRGELHEWQHCLDSFTGHSGGGINAVAFSPDNVFFVSGGGDGMVKVWQTSTRTLVLDIPASRVWIRAVAYSPNGLHIAAGGDDGLSIWHAASGVKIRTITDNNLVHVVYTADGSRLLSVGSRKVRLWQVSNGECLLSLDGVKVGRQVGMSPDGAVIAFTRGASLFLHHVSSGKCEDLELRDWGRAVAFSFDGRYVAAATADEIRIWSHQDKSLVRSIHIPRTFHGGLSFSPDNSRICCTSTSGVIYVWFVESGDLVHEFEGHMEWIFDVSWSPDGSQVVSVGGDCTIRLWDVTDHFPARQPPASSDRPRSGSPRALVAEYGGRRMMLDHPPHPIADLFLPSYHNVTVIEAPIFTSHPNRTVAWDHVVNSTPTWQLEVFYSWAALTGQNNFSSKSEAEIAISSDGSLVAYPAARNICIRSLITGDVVATLTPEFESGVINSIAFSPDDSRLASGSNCPAGVAVWDVAAGVCVANHHAHSSLVVCVIFSSDGRFVFSSSYDKTIRVFDISTKQVTGVLDTHGHSAHQLMLTTDDKLLIIQDAEGALYLWNIETNSRIASFSSSDEFWITTLCFSPTGFSVSTEDGEHTVELWKADDRAWPVYYISEEGWVYAKGPGYTRRLAWLLPEWRHPVWSDGAIFCVGEEHMWDDDAVIDNLIELDMSSLLDHAGILYAK